MSSLVELVPWLHPDPLLSSPRLCLSVRLISGHWSVSWLPLEITSEMLTISSVLSRFLFRSTHTHTHTLVNQPVELLCLVFYIEKDIPRSEGHTHTLIASRLVFFFQWSEKEKNHRELSANALPVQSFDFDFRFSIFWLFYCHFYLLFFSRRERERERARGWSWWWKSVFICNETGILNQDLCVFYYLDAFITRPTFKPTLNFMSSSSSSSFFVALFSHFSSTDQKQLTQAPVFLFVPSNRSCLSNCLSLSLSLSLSFVNSSHASSFPGVFCLLHRRVPEYRSSNPNWCLCRILLSGPN